MIKLRTPGKKIDLAFWNKKIEDRFDFLELKFEDKSGKRIEYSTYIWNKFYNNACLRLKIGFLTCCFKMHNTKLRPNENVFSLRLIADWIIFHDQLVSCRHCHAIFRNETT